jgi:hypothetical protein
MLGDGGGPGCVADSFDIPNQVAIVSRGVKDGFLIGRALGRSLSIADATEQIGLRFFEDACDRRFFWAAACADDGSNFQLPADKEIWAELGGFWFR